MNRITTLLFGLFFSTLLLAQQTKSKVDYDNDSRWFWGANVGVTWNTTDVKNKNYGGWGLTLGKSFNYTYGKAFSFDIRGRYLTGKWYGQDYDTTGFQYANPALSSGNTDYKTAYGYSVLNFQTQVQRASLELVIHANNLRAKTGWDVFIFGGIGYTWYRTKGNLINSSTNSIYRYDSLATINKGSVNGLLDGSYDTYLNGNGNKYSGAWMPSLGFGIGHQVGPRFSIGLEHKTTFTLLDNFDGYANPTSKYKDIYHYTSAYVRFQIRDHANVVDPEDNSLNNVNNYNQTQNQTNVPPIVDFRNPAVTGTTVSTPSYVIRADVKNVPSSNNVVFRQNGNYISTFNFNPSTQQFESSVTLTPGQNIFELTGTNAYGSDQEQTIIIYNREQQNPPVVNYVNPASSPTTVQNPVYNESATVFNVTQQSQVTMQLNGQQFTAFTFNPANNLVTSTLNLQVGTNIVTTTGTNQYGTASQSTTIIYNPQQQIEQPPVVYFVDPNVNPYTTSQGTFLINAEVLNVAGSQNITFKQNGSVNQNFTYNATSHNFQSSVVLTPGQNVFELIGTNSAGTAQATTIIIYTRQAPKPPIVTITNPSNNPQEVSNANYTLAATVLNVTQQSQVMVAMNGQSIANFTFTPSTSGVTANLNLVQGTNIVTVTGTNNDGTDYKQTTLIYRVPVTVQPPVVTFSAPNTDPFTTDQPTYNAVASVLNVTNQSGVNVNVNGVNVTNFTFNTANSLVNLPLTLIEGANVITITGTNTAGTDSEPQTIIYRKPVPVQPPVVSFIDPSVNPTTVFNQTYDVRARVRYVAGAQQIVLRINGQISANFAYSASSEIMTFTTGLVPGANIVEITATNSAGQDQESTTIIYRQPNPTLPPVVTITNPIANPTTVSTSSAPITATVLNVDGAQNIQVLVNNTPISGFTYNTATKQLTFTMNLVAGSNALVINATNTAGQASDNRTIIFRREQIVQPPLVTFINPAAPGTTVTTAGYTVKARVNNVDGASQVVVIQDGQIVSPNLWNFDAGTKEVTFNTTLNAGNNVFTVTGTNSAGANSATTSILYTIPVVICDKPVATFTAPATGGTQVENPSFNVAVTIQHITSANQVKLYVNGALQTPGSYNLANGAYTKTVTLAVGQNSLEVLATNNCGDVKATSTIIYKVAAAPCNPPTVQRVDPQAASMVVETETANIKASVSNVDNVSQISVVVNGTSVPFSYDAAAHFVTANVALAVGNNTVAVVVSTACGKARADWGITRQACNAPTVSITSATVADGAMTTGESFGLVAAITGVTSNNNITVTQNGQNIGFVFSSQTNVLTLDHPLTLGVNKFIITVSNTCGQNTVTYTATRRQDPNAVPPTIQITNPASTPFQTQQQGMTVQIALAHVSSANQVSVMVNGVSTNFNFSNGSISFNTNFNVGANVIVATAATQYGTATDSKTVVYTQPVVVNPPVISLTNPARCPGTFNRGNATITGSVTNISNPSQVVILFNNENVSFTSNVVGNTLNFTFNVSISATTVNIPLVITATNAGGTDMKTCAISIATEATTTEGDSNGGVINGTIRPHTEGTGGEGGTGGVAVPRPAGSTVRPTGTITTPVKVGRP